MLMDERLIRSPQRLRSTLIDFTRLQGALEMSYMTPLSRVFTTCGEHRGLNDSLLLAHSKYWTAASNQKEQVVASTV